MTINYLLKIREVCSKHSRRLLIGSKYTATTSNSDVITQRFRSASIHYLAWIHFLDLSKKSGSKKLIHGSLRYLWNDPLRSCSCNRPQFYLTCNATTPRVGDQ